MIRAASRQTLVRYDQQAKLQCKATLAKGHTRSPAIPSVNIIVFYSFENACYLDGFKSIWGMCVYL